MQIKREQLSPTTIKLSITADQAFLDAAKQAVMAQLARGAKVPGFRPGKAPANLIEKQLDPAALQSEFVDQSLNQLYVAAVEQQKLRPVAPPQVALTKFVPYTTLEFTAEVEVVGDITLPDYTKVKVEAKSTEVTAKDVNGVVDNLRSRAAAKQEVKRAAKTGDEVTIDFTGTDAKTNDAIDGADGTAYPLILGSNSFIPGFEDQLVGLKVGDDKTFPLTFPKDYGAPELQNRKVKFAVKVTKVQELAEPKLDDAFAATIGPFKTLAELKTDIKKQLKAEKQQEANRALDNDILLKIAEKTTAAIPKVLVDEEIDRAEEEEKRNIVYRGQTWQEHLDAEGLDAEAHREKQRPAAELRVKAGLILGEISNREKITVSQDDIDLRIRLLKGQYSDPAMLAELDKPENRADIRNRLLTEKTLDKLRAFAAAK